MKTIILAPYSKKLRNGKENPKNYPHWEEVAHFLISADFRITQLLYAGEKQIEHTFAQEYTSLKMCETLVRQSDLFLSVDNFLPHLAHTIGKRGVVIWGTSDPLIFGYPENVNLLKDRKYLRGNQFEI